MSSRIIEGSYITTRTVVINKEKEIAAVSFEQYADGVVFFISWKGSKWSNHVAYSSVSKAHLAAWDAAAELV